MMSKSTTELQGLLEGNVYEGFWELWTYMKLFF